MVSANDCVWIVSITGIDNHQIPAVHIGTVGAFTMSNQGPAILIFNKAAYTENNNYIISSTQLEHYHNCVDDHSTLAGGTQHISTVDGYTFPLSIKQVLPLSIRTLTPRMNS